MITRFLICLSFICLPSLPAAATDNSSTGSTSHEQQALNSILPENQRKLGDIYLKGRYERCLKELDHALRSEPTRRHDSLLFLRGLCAYRLDQREIAQAAFESSLALRARNSDAIHYLGELAALNGQFELSLSRFKEAIWQNAYALLSPADSLYQKALVYKSADQTQEFIRHIESAASKNPPHRQAILTISNHLAETGDKEAALAHLNRAARYYKDDLDFHTSRTLILARTLNLPSSGSFQVRDLQQAKTLSAEVRNNEDLEPPKRTEASKLYARSLLSLGQLTEARRVLDELKKELPNDHEIERMRQQLQLQSRVAQTSSDSLDSPDTADEL